MQRSKIFKNLKRLNRQSSNSKVKNYFGKKDRRMRIFIYDFKLNAITKKIEHPVLQIEHIFGILNCAKCFLTLSRYRLQSSKGIVQESRKYRVQYNISVKLVQLY